MIGPRCRALRQGGRGQRGSDQPEEPSAVDEALKTDERGRPTWCAMVPWLRASRHILLYIVFSPELWTRLGPA